MMKLVSCYWCLRGGQLPIAIMAVEPEKKVHIVLGAENLWEGKSVNSIQTLQGRNYSRPSNHSQRRCMRRILHVLGRIIFKQYAQGI
jgi:hypothetical protein